MKAQWRTPTEIHTDLPDATIDLFPNVSVYSDNNTVNTVTRHSQEEVFVEALHRVTFLGVERLERSEPVVLCLEVGLLGMW